MDIPFHASTAQIEGTIALTDTSRVQIVILGPTTVIVDPFSGSKSECGITVVHLHNIVNVAVADPSLVVMGPDVLKFFRTLPTSRQAESSCTCGSAVLMNKPTPSSTSQS